MKDKILLVMTLLKYFGVLLAVVLTSCGKDEVSPELLVNDWKVVKLKKENDRRYTESDETYVLKFTSDSTFGIRLDVNSCGGNYEIEKEGTIDMVLICTYICCDSDFAEALAGIIAGATKYNFKGNELILEGPGKIVLERY
jgi:hypothetical protein